MVYNDIRKEVKVLNIDFHNSKHAITVFCDTGEEYTHIKNVLEVERRKSLEGNLPGVTEPILTLYEDRIHIHKQPFDFTQTMASIKVVEFTEGQIVLTEESGENHVITIQHADLFGPALEIARLSKGYSLHDLEELTGINKGTLSKYERDQSKISQGHLEMLQRVFSSPVNLYKKESKGQVNANKVIKEAMTKHDIQVKDIALHLGISQATAYSMIRNPKLSSKLIKLCLLLQVNLWDLINPSELLLNAT
jgi:DNA-binding Xre family transcriptional regulator